MKSLTASALVLVDVAEIGTAKPSVRMFPILESSLGLRCKQPNPSYVAGSDSLSAIALTRTSRKLLLDNALRLSVEVTQPCYEVGDDWLSTQNGKSHLLEGREADWLFPLARHF